MGMRGPKSESQLNLLPIFDGRSRPLPFHGMSKRAKKTWKDIVNSLPPDYFKQGALYLLKAYCEAEAVHHQACMAAEKTLLVKAGSGGLKANPAIAIQTAKASEMATLAVKLRLSVNSYRGSDQPTKEIKNSPRGDLLLGGRGK